MVVLSRPDEYRLEGLSPDVVRSLDYCHAVTRTRARNFYYGLKLTPEPKRSALYAVYALMRACDDLADASLDEHGRSLSPDASMERIEAFRRDMVQAIATDSDAFLPQGPLWPAVRYVGRTYEIDLKYLHLMLDGQREDLAVPRTVRYDTFEQLYSYCYKVASTVGLVCLNVWGHDGDAGVPKLAEYRGIAFQLTNILRDLKEDAHRDRVYLPQEDLDRFGITAQDFCRKPAPLNFERMMTYQIERARSYYEMSDPLERHVAPQCRATSWAMTRIYRRLLERIAASPRRVLTRRVRLSSWRKASIATQAAWKNHRNKNQPWPTPQAPA